MLHHVAANCAAQKALGILPRAFTFASLLLLVPRKSTASLSYKKLSLVLRSVFCTSLAYHFFAGMGGAFLVETLKRTRMACPTLPVAEKRP
jgi:hypothetical protein